MKNAKLRKGVLLVALASMTVIGCELIVDFDRTKIPVDDGGAAVPDGNVPDVVADAPADAPEEAATDGGEGGTDAADEAGDADVDADQ